MVLTRELGNGSVKAAASNHFFKKGLIFLIRAQSVLRYDLIKVLPTHNLYVEKSDMRDSTCNWETLVLLLDDLKSDKSNSDEDLKVLKLLKDEVNEKKIQGLTFLRNLKNSFPEVYKTIETRQASRDLLNYQKSEFSSMVKLGRVDKDDADKFLLEIEYKMNELLSNPPSFILPNAIDLLKQIPWIKSLDDNELSKISKIVEIKIFPLNYNFPDELKIAKVIPIFKKGNQTDFTNYRPISVLPAISKIFEKIIEILN